VRFVVAVDQGTTATKAYTLDEAGAFHPVCELAHEQILPRQAAMAMAEERVRKAMSFRRWSLFSSAPDYT